MMSEIRRFLNEEDGLAATEYAMILAVVAITAFGAFDLLGDNVKTVVDNMKNKMVAQEQ